MFFNMGADSAAELFARSFRRLGPLVAAQPGIAEIADPAKVRLLFANIRRWRHGFAAWKLLFYALWHRRHILALPPAGDVFQTLAAT